MAAANDTRIPESSRHERDAFSDGSGKLVVSRSESTAATEFSIEGAEFGVDYARAVWIRDALNTEIEAAENYQGSND